MAPKPITQNTLFYGDNLDILREYLPTESIDLIYLDPPFNSNRSYNVLFKDEGGLASEAQISAFDDSWHWGPSAEAAYTQLMRDNPGKVDDLIAALMQVIGKNQMMAYLVMMAARLVELHRVLKPTGSLYLHCDPTASHYLKIILDTVFSPQNFRNEIIWERQSSHNDARRKYASVTDTILFYSKTDDFIFNVQYAPYDDGYVANNFRFIDEKGRRYSSRDLRSPNPRPNLTYEYKGFKPHANGWSVSLEKMEELDRQGRLIFPSTPEGRIRLKLFLDELPGIPVGNLWDDISLIQSQALERLGYPTQKPLALLERIILASSNPGDTVLDPFCGCGTAIAAAQRLNRRWIGIDITHLAISLIKYRMENMFPDCKYSVVGEPQDIGSARRLAQDDRYQFQWWALSLIRARPQGGEGTSKQGKKGSDQGIDGVINIIDDPKEKIQRIIVQVKSGHVKSGDIRDLRGVVEREGAAMGVYITLEPASEAMLKEAVSAGYYHSKVWNQDYPKIQILTIEDLLKGKQVQMPPDYGTFKQAQKVKKNPSKQGELGI